jgi:hypothetical protein
VNHFEIAGFGVVSEHDLHRTARETDPQERRVFSQVRLAISAGGRLIGALG